MCKVVSASCTELYSIAGAGRAGAAWSELSRWKGRIETLTTRHSRRWVESHAKQMAWQVRRGGSETQNKQNNREKNIYGALFRFSCAFQVWGFVLHKQPWEELIFSREFQPHYKNKFENHSDRGRCDLLQRAPTSLFHLSHLQTFPLQGKKVRMEVIIPAGEPAAGKAVSTPGRGSQHTSLYFFLNTKTTHGLYSPSICHWKLSK